MKMAQSNVDQMPIAVGITSSSPVIYESGQRRCGPPDHWTGSPPGKGCEIFIAKIPRDCFENDLIPILKEIGEIYTFRLMMENETSHRGFGFCVYTKIEFAKEAVFKLNNYQIKKNWYLGVCFSVDNCRLFVGGIPKLKTKAEIFEEMSSVTENVVDIIVYPSAADKNKNRGFAFVEYTTHKAAAIARKKMITNGIQLWNHTVAVDWAEPERKVEDEVMLKVKILYVRNLMLTTSEETIYHTFSKYITDDQEIIKVKKIGDFAFVHFKNREQAEIVKNKAHGINLEGSVIEVHFAKPVNKIEQQQKMLKKSNANLNQALPMILANDLNRLSIGSGSNQQISPDVNDRNGLFTNRSFRNAAGRCSIKSKQMMKYLDNNENLSHCFVNLLNQICQKYGWGVPFYTIQIVPMIFPNNENSVNVFIANVYIPGLNFHFPSKSPAFSQEEAILYVSEIALHWLFSNGVQVPFQLDINEHLQNNETNATISDPDSSQKHPNNLDPPEPIRINNNIGTQPNPSPFFMSNLLPYNPLTPFYGNNYVVQNNPDQIIYPIQAFSKG